MTSNACPKVLTTMAFLKEPQAGRRVELCSEENGRLYAVKIVEEKPAQRGGMQASLLYDLFSKLGYTPDMNYLPKRFMKLNHTSYNAAGDKVTELITEYCQGHDLEELVQYAALSGEGLPEPFLWHIIKAFIEFCYVLERFEHSLAVFQPAHVLFVFSAPGPDEIAELAYPRVVFCGTSGIIDRRGDDPKFDRTTELAVNANAFRGLGSYLLTHIEGIPSHSQQTVCYSEALISWLKIIAGVDDGPPRFVDLQDISILLHTRIEEFIGPATTLNPTSWLFRYFDQLRLGLDCQYSILDGWNRQSLEDTFQNYKDELRQYHKISHETQLPPWIDDYESESRLISKLSTYLRPALKGSIAEEMSLEEIREHLSDSMHKCFERCITLGRWSATYMKDPGCQALSEIETTCFQFDWVEFEVLRRTVDALGQCQRAILKRLLHDTEEMNTITSARVNSIQQDTMAICMELLVQAGHHYETVFNDAAWEGDFWKNSFRNAGVSVRMRKACLLWERWFAIQVQGYQAMQVWANAKKPTLVQVYNVEMDLRRELGLPLDKSLQDLEEPKIHASSYMANVWYRRDNGGFVFTKPDWKNDLESGDAHQSPFDQPDAAQFRDKLRSNGARAAEGDLSPKDMRESAPWSPKPSIAGEIEYAVEMEVEYSKMHRPPRLPPRRRKDITWLDNRVYKIMKRWPTNYRKGSWYTAGSLYENFRHQFIERKRPLREIKDDFNRKRPGGRLDIKLDEQNCNTYLMGEKFMEAIMGLYEPLMPFKEMRPYSESLDPNLPVLEEPMLWDFDDSSGEEDSDTARWVSKHKSRRT